MTLPRAVAVVGAGTMGNGIAQVFAAHGVPAFLVDVDQGLVDRGLAAIGKSLARFVKKEKLSQAEADAILGRVRGTTSQDCFADAELIVEAVTENVEIKKRIFAAADARAPQGSVLASNTSSISITVLGAATGRPAEVIGMHFMNPVPLMQLVEVIRGHATSAATTARVTGWARALGKVPVEASDYPGFISNRVLMPMINEAAYCLMEGVSSREGIDEIMKLGMNHPMGPLALADFVGIDVCVSILDVLKDGLGDDRYRACPLMRRMVAAGHLGRKTGRGFYEYRRTVTISTSPQVTDFELAPDLLGFQAAIRRFAEEEIAPHAAQWDRDRSFPARAIERAGELGLLRMAIPEEYGGTDMGSLASCVMLEEINAVCPSTGVTISVHNSLFCAPLAKWGSVEQQGRIFPKMLTGEWLGAYCLSEAVSGSDAAGLICKATRDGDDWVLDGPKLWITSGSEASVFIVFARSGEDRVKGISAYLVERDRDGVGVGKKERKLGIRASPTTEILLRNVRVPAANLLGEEGRGFPIALDTLDGGRLGIAAQSLGIARAAVELIRDHLRGQHDAKGRSTASQNAQWTLADLAADLDAYRMLTWRAAVMRDRGVPVGPQSAMAKLCSSRLANRATRAAVSLLGLDGAAGANAAERFLRDARITEIYEGATDIQRLVVARGVLS